MVRNLRPNFETYLPSPRSVYIYIYVCVCVCILIVLSLLLTFPLTFISLSLSLSLSSYIYIYMRVCVCAIDIGSILQSPWLLHLPARYCGVPVSLYEQQNYLYDYCPRMLLLVVLVGFSLRWLIGAAIEARPRPLSGTQPPLSLSLSHTHTHTHTHSHSLSLSLSHQG